MVFISRVAALITLVRKRLDAGQFDFVLVARSKAERKKTKQNRNSKI